MSFFETVVRPALFRLDPERGHTLSIAALKGSLLPSSPSPHDRRLKCTIAGLDFPNPVGLAAGYDKNAQVPDALLSQGFGFVEVGTLTPRPQPGNPRPRLFRLEHEHGAINRMGFNNDGLEAARVRLAARKAAGGIVGVNIGANKDSDDFVADYEIGLERMWHVADYFTANVSSPNTPGLRNLQAREALTRMLSRLMRRRSDLAGKTGFDRPLFLKIAPDLEDMQMDDIAAAIVGSGLDGLIVSNTTLSRPGVSHSRFIAEAGGLSGRPLFVLSTIVLARMRERIGDLPIIGVGGIEDARTAIAKLEAGANLIQLYTGMIFRGPAIAAEINRGLLDFMATNGISNISELTGRRTREWALRNLPEES